MRSPIGIFDSGYGGLTILSAIRKQLPQYDYIYLGDNARAPYGTRSFEVINDFTLQAVEYLFAEGCPLVILACNTASAKALRAIQQHYLPFSQDPSRRVLGVIRPTVEAIEGFTETGHVGVVATPGTISSHSYEHEIAKLFPHVQVTGQACPMWVPLVEYGESQSPGADYFVRHYLEQLLARDADIDTLILACTHYPLLSGVIQLAMGEHVTLVSSAEETAKDVVRILSENDMLAERDGDGAEPVVRSFESTGDPALFAQLADRFLGPHVTQVSQLGAV